MDFIPTNTLRLISGDQEMNIVYTRYIKTIGLTPEGHVETKLFFNGTDLDESFEVVQFYKVLQTGKNVVVQYESNRLEVGSQHIRLTSSESGSSWDIEILISLKPVI